jgi:hypothetical protein
MAKRKTYRFAVPDFDECGGRTNRWVDVPGKVVREIEADIRERCAKVADDHARRAWEIGAAEGQNEICSSGRNHAARAIASAIREGEG